MEPRYFRVLLSSQLVGVLAQQIDGRLAFRLDPAYVALGQRPVLSQSFEDDLSRAYSGKRPGDLPAYFSNLLPEGRFRRVVEQSIGDREEGDLGLLVALGSDLPGAVILVEEDSGSAFEVGDSGYREETPGREQLAFRFSLAGVQLKFSMVESDGQLTIPAYGGGGDWLVKVGVQDYPALAENEFSMLEWARAAGFEVPKCLLIAVSDLGLAKYAPPGTYALAVRRYDRDDGRRIHQEDFMQVFGRAADPLGRQKYNASVEELAGVVLGVLGQAGYDELVRRMALVVALGNNDAHLKNWSLLYRDPAKPIFAPVYDQVSTVAWPTLDRTLALKLAGSRDFGRVSADSFDRLARKVGMDPIKTMALVRQTLDRLRESWRAHFAEWPLPSDQKTVLLEHWEKVPLLLDSGPLG